MSRTNLNKIFTGFSSYLNCNYAVNEVGRAVLKSRFSSPSFLTLKRSLIVGRLFLPACVPRVMSNDCHRYLERNIHNSRENVELGCIQSRSNSVYAAKTNISTRDYRQHASAIDEDRDLEELGEWSQSADIADEVLGDLKNFRISSYLADRLKAQDIKYLFPVQMSTFDPVYDGHDVIVQARTGSGKTLSYGIPLVELLLQTTNNTPGRSPRLMVMTPTRELARQVSEVIESLSDRLSVGCIYGGAPAGPQESKIRGGLDVLVGTPGRIQDFLEKRVLNLKFLSHVVLDEVDRMLDMGFADSVESILKERYVSGNSNDNPQTLLFSATVPPWVQRTAKKYLRPGLKKLDLVGKGTNRAATTVEHLAIDCPYHSRTLVIASVLQVYSGDHGRAIVFCETKREADKLAASGAIKQESHVLHGDIPQEKREMVLKGFRNGRYKCLIATDVAARGLDIPEVDLVVQCSPSKMKDVDSYIHRSGRTGRAGRTGISVMLYGSAEFQYIRSLEKAAGFNFKKISAPKQPEIIAAMAKDAASSLNMISEAVAQNFSTTAEALIAERGAVPALAAALAVISGSANKKEHSLLTSRSGFTTYTFRTTAAMSHVGYAWQSLKRQLPVDVAQSIRGMQLCADRQGCVFDLPSNYDSVIQERWKNDKFDTLAIASELPEMIENQYSRTDFRSSYESGSRLKKQTGAFGRYKQTKGFHNRRLTEDESCYDDDDGDDEWSNKNTSARRRSYKGLYYSES